MIKKIENWQEILNRIEDEKLNDFADMLAEEFQQAFMFLVPIFLHYCLCWTCYYWSESSKATRQRSKETKELEVEKTTPLVSLDKP